MLGGEIFLLGSNTVNLLCKCGKFCYLSNLISFILKMCLVINVIPQLPRGSGIICANDTCKVQRTANGLPSLCVVLITLFSSLWTASVIVAHSGCLSHSLATEPTLLLPSSSKMKVKGIFFFKGLSWDSGKPASGFQPILRVTSISSAAPTVQLPLRPASLTKARAHEGKPRIMAPAPPPLPPNSSL